MKSHKTKLLISIAVLILFIFLLARFVVSNWNDFKELEFTNPALLLLLVPVFVFNLLVNGKLMDVVLRPLKISLDTHETLGLSAMTRLGNYIAPLRLGFSVRVVYLKKKYKISITHFLSALSAQFIIMFLGSSILGTLAALYLAANGSVENMFMVWVLIGTLVSTLLIIVFSPKIKESDVKIKRYLSNFINGWHEIKTHPQVFKESVYWALLTMLSFAFLIYLEFNIFGENISFVVALYIAAVSSLNVIIGITPAGLGINEALVVVAAQSVGVSGTTALAAALLRRVLAFSVSLLISLYYSKRLLGSSIFRIYKRDAS